MWRIRGVLRDYDWGAVDGLAAWSKVTGGPQAELWFGLHPSAPSPVVDDSGAPTSLTLDQAMPAQRHPLLVKLLAAQRPLSIQVHPSRELAEVLHARGVLPDAEAKAETLLALAPFSVHAGWRDFEEATAILSGAGVPEARVRSWSSRAEAVRDLLSFDADQVADLIEALPAAAERFGLDGAAIESLRRVADSYPRDPGVLVCVLMQHLVLGPGQAIDVEPGMVHSYVQGLGVEVMTSSDNVLRLGLTSKPVHPEESLGALRDLDDDPAFPFRVDVVRDGEVALDSGFRLVLPLEGSARVVGASGEMALAAGLAGVLGEDEPACTAFVNGSAVIAQARQEAVHR